MPYALYIGLWACAPVPAVYLPCIVLSEALHNAYITGGYAVNLSSVKRGGLISATRPHGATLTPYRYCVYLYNQTGYIHIQSCGYPMRDITAPPCGGLWLM